jgi:small subunit ribosomal protein S20
MAVGTATKVKKREISSEASCSVAGACEVNRGHRSRVRYKSLRSALRTGDPAAAGPLLRPTLSAIDRAVSKGVLTRNSANRYKSRLTLATNSLAKTKKA